MLLIIAFGTILRLETYSYKVCLASGGFAVLINFSKTISGLLIGLSQVVMLTLSKRLQVQVERVLLLRLDLVILPMLHSGAFANAPDKLLSSLVSRAFRRAVIGNYGYCPAFDRVFLVWRIINLWILIILSPISYLLYAFPGGAG